MKKIVVSIINVTTLLLIIFSVFNFFSFFIGYKHNNYSEVGISLPYVADIKTPLIYGICSITIAVILFFIGKYLKKQIQLSQLS